MPPVLTFQSVIDFTVSTRAIVNALYQNLPAQGSELVLFDINHNTLIGPLLRPTAETVLPAGAVTGFSGANGLPAAPRSVTVWPASSWSSASVVV